MFDFNSVFILSVSLQVFRKLSNMDRRSSNSSGCGRQSSVVVITMVEPFEKRLCRLVRRFRHVSCYVTWAQGQTVTTDQLGGDWTGSQCELGGDGKPEVHKRKIRF